MLFQAPTVLEVRMTFHAPINTYITGIVPCVINVLKVSFRYLNIWGDSFNLVSPKALFQVVILIKITLAFTK